MFSTILNTYLKLIVMILFALGVDTVTVLFSGIQSPSTYIAVGLTTIGTVGVWAARNHFYGVLKYAKGIVAGVALVGTPTVLALVTGHITTSQIVLAVFALLGTTSVVAVTNQNPAVDAAEMEFSTLLPTNGEDF